MPTKQTAPPPTHRARLMDALRARHQVQSLFALAMDLSIPYNRAHQFVCQAEQKQIVKVERPSPGYPLVITWIGEDGH